MPFVLPIIFTGYVVIGVVWYKLTGCRNDHSSYSSPNASRSRRHIKGTAEYNNEQIFLMHDA